MNSWATSLEQIWRSPSFPMWLTLAAAGFFGLIVLITLLRAEKSVANGALTIITLVAIAVAGAATIRSYGPAGQGAAAVPAAPLPATTASLPALSCLDDLAGDAVMAACEKVLFGSADSTASAVSYAAAKITRLVAFGDVAAANKAMTPELMALRHAVERDRYGLIAYVLQTRERCQSNSCPVFASLTDHAQIAAHMDEAAYDGLITRYSATWNAPPAAAAALTGALAGLPPSVPTGKPTTADFPTSASIPPINIMTPEPVPRAPPAPRAPPSAANAQDPRPATTAAVPATPAAPKKQAAPKAPRPQAQAPVSLAPAAAPPDN